MWVGTMLSPRSRRSALLGHMLSMAPEKMSMPSALIDLFGVLGSNRVLIPDDLPIVDADAANGNRAGGPNRPY